MGEERGPGSGHVLNGGAKEVVASSECRESGKDIYIAVV